jgi:hypothetical protein
MQRLWLVSFALAVAFITIGFSGQRTFLYVGIGFLILSLVRLLRSRT